MQGEWMFGLNVRSRGGALAEAFLTALGVSLIRDSGFLELDLQRIAIRRLEEAVPERAVDFDGAPHNGVRLRIVFQNHAAIIPKEEEVWRRHPPEIKQLKANMGWLERAKHKPKR